MGGRQKKKGNKKATGQKKAKSKTEQQPEPEPEPEREPEPQPQPGLGFGKGDLVLIHGLTGAPQHNGKTGTVLSFAEATGRYRVQLHGEYRPAAAESQLVVGQGHAALVGLRPCPAQPELR